MTEQELLDMFIQERINMLLNHLKSNTSKKTPEENGRIVQAEHFIRLLPPRGKVLVQDYIDYLIDLFSKDEPFLYQQGFLDGIRAMKFIYLL